MQLRRLLLVVASIAVTAAIARAQSVDDPVQWRGVALARALAAAETIDDPYRRAETLASIARVQTLIGDVRAAIARFTRRSLQSSKSASRRFATGC